LRASWDLAARETSADSAEQEGREAKLEKEKESEVTSAVDSDGTDVFFGLSVKGALTKNMVSLMADKPIIFAMANPDPEITPEEARAVSPHAIIATGRSDYPNHVNNVLGFPYIFRGALDVRASTINDAMKIAAAAYLMFPINEPETAERPKHPAAHATMPR